jgi:hypothetical protein
MERYANFLITGERPPRKLPRKQRPILKLEAGEPWALAREAVEYADDGRCDLARSEIRQAQQLVQPDNLIMLKFVGLVHWSCGQRTRARALLTTMKRRADARNHGLDIAWLHARFGDKDSAFAWLEHQAWTIADLSSLSASHWLDPLRTDPRFTQLLRRLGLRAS